MSAPALGMHEIEVKYRVADSVGLLAALDRLGVKLTPSVVQDDQAYAPSWWRYGMSKVGVSFARLRTQDGRHLFTVKRPVDNELACEEYETVVADRGQLHAAVVAMGFTPTVRIVKTRRSGVWDGAAVCVDVVEGLGTFLELERLVAAEVSGAAAQNALDRQVRGLGVALDRVTDTYDSLLRATTNGG